jgi:hypothetical protein
MRTSESKGRQQTYDSSVVFGFEVPIRASRFNRRNFKSTTLAIFWKISAGVKGTRLQDFCDFFAAGLGQNRRRDRGTVKPCRSSVNARQSIAGSPAAPRASMPCFARENLIDRPPGNEQSYVMNRKRGLASRFLRLKQIHGALNRTRCQSSCGSRFVRLTSPSRLIPPHANFLHAQRCCECRNWKEERTFPYEKP